MRFVGLSQTNNKNVVRKISAISALLLISACSPLSSRLVEPANSSRIYPLTDSFVTNSIPSGGKTNYKSSRQVTSSSLAPIENDSAIVAVKTANPISNNGVITVRSGDTLLGVARKHGVDAVDLAELNSLDAPYGLKVGEELVLPGTPAVIKTASRRNAKSRLATANTAAPKVRKTRTVALPATKPKKKLLKIAQAKPVLKPDVKKITKVVIPRKKAANKSFKKKLRKKPVRIASVEKPLVKEKPAIKRNSAKRSAAKQQANAEIKFRWPVRGRVISEFGSKTNGAKNDGINLSVPKGAAIVAAENGLVVYSGNELKGYGNLVLIRHKDGWSTAYAHISEMLVEKGQQVRRGQVIAKAGQTGSVSRPQLHFELRRGTNPVNPRKYLSGTKVATR